MAKATQFRKLTHEKIVEKHPAIKEWVKPGLEFGEVYDGKTTYAVTIVNGRPDEYLDEDGEWFPCPDISYVELQ